MGFVPDDGAVQELVAQGFDPSFGVRVCLRRPRWDPDRGDPGPGEDGVEGTRELSGSISDHESKPMTVAEPHHEVACSLGCPRAGRVRGDPGEMHPSCRVFDDEQNMAPSEEHGVDAGEVGGKDDFGLRVDELGPGGPGPITGRVDACRFENLPDC